MAQNLYESQVLLNHYRNHAPIIPGADGECGMTGLQDLKMMARIALEPAQSLANPVAVELGLEDCLVIPQTTQASTYAIRMMNGGYKSTTENGTITFEALRSPAQTVSSIDLIYAAWIGPIPVGLCWSYRCHNRNCINIEHGIWETALQSSSRDNCESRAFLLLNVEDKILRICPHNPPCLTGIVIDSWDDPRFMNIAQ